MMPCDPPESPCLDSAARLFYRPVKLPRDLKNRIIVYFIGFTAALAGLLFGLDIGVISGAQTFIQAEFGITDRVIEIVVSALLWGAVFGALISGFFSNRFGRRRTILGSAIIFVVGAALCALSPSVHLLIAARFVLGIAVGMASFTAPLYLAEISPQAVRGGMISMYQLMITIGILMAFLSDTFFSTFASDRPMPAMIDPSFDGQYLKSYVIGVAHSSGAWRLMLGVITIPAVVMFIGVYFLPESPRWLFLNGFQERAVQVFKRLHLSDADIASEVREIEDSVRVPQKGFQLFLQNPNFRRAVFLGVGLQIIQQLTGINVIMYYAPRIFGMAGFESTIQQMWGTVIIGVTNVLATFIAIAFVDRIGRKPIMYAGFIVMGAALLTVGTLFRMGVDQHTDLAYPAMFALIVFIIGFAMSAGPIIWVLCSEIYPLSGRDFGITCSTGTNWIANAIVGMTFLTLVNGIGSGNAFLLYGALNILFIIFFLLFVPETKGVSLEHIQANLLAGKRLKSIGR
jgi:SP family galactose:H+ symporter-like MFS transporter